MLSLWLFFGWGVLFSLEELNTFHSYGCSLFLMVLVFVLLMLFFLIQMVLSQKLLLFYKEVEFYCCLLPVLILLGQMIPSLVLLWKMNYFYLSSSLTVKVIGHQWYWSYDYSDFENLEFDSYMKSVDSLLLSESRLLDVDNRCVVPTEVNIRFCITSADVIHAWTLSSLSFKLDAMSGILSILNYNFPLVGVYYGQCSEICGANHSFMPIVVEVTLFELFKSWCLLI
uniref:Cytochrome c oxidase subunit 2 n=1 Tax=Pratylenchus vulnus TaxID=45931 RepID=M1E1L8_PRAVU|nr:cytochrome c oxidase subunit II [Pratylenchus vulnus]